MNTSRRRLLVRLLHGGVVLTASGLLPAHTMGMEKNAADIEKREKKGQTIPGGAQAVHADSIADMQALDVARLHDGQRVEVASFHAGGTLGGGSFIWYANEQRAEDGGTCFRAHDQAGGRFLRRLDDMLTPAMFGARGDGSDQYPALKQLAQVASTQQRDVIFPEGDFASSGTGLRFTGIHVTGAGVRRTTIRYTGDARGSLVEIDDGATLSGMTLDGNVSDDPAHWSASNHDAFTGCLPLDLMGHDVTAHDLVCRRSPLACLRVGGARNFVLRDVIAEHARGNYGDGIFIVDAHDGIVERCQARDFTRIGFVSDTYGESPEHILSERIDFIDCLAENGHHASIDYGDDEYNAGFWAENSHDVRFINCRSRNTTHHGFVATTGRIPTLGIGHFTLRGCIAETTGDGYLLSDLHGIPVRHTVDDCLARDVARGFCIEMDLAASRLTGQRFTTFLRGSRRSGNTLSLTGDGHIDIRHLNETWQTFYPRRHESIRASYASVVAADGFKGALHLAHFQSRHGTDEPSAVGFKLIGQSHLRDFTLTDTHARLFHVPAERISLQDCEIPSGWVKAFDALDVDTCRLGDGVPRFDIFETTQQHRYRHCQFDFTPGGGHLYLHNSDKRNSRHVVRFETCHFKKNLTEHGYMITLDAAPGVFLAKESNYLTFRDCTFENTGQATNIPAIRTHQRPPQAALIGHGNRKNATLNTLTTFELDDGLMAEG